MVFLFESVLKNLIIYTSFIMSFVTNILIECWILYKSLKKNFPKEVFFKILNTSYFIDYLSYCFYNSKLVLWQ